MGKSNEHLIKIVYELINQMRIPIIDERVYDSIKVKTKPATVSVIFEFDEDESVIEGFLGLADYFHTVVLKDDDEFYIPTDESLYILKNA